MPLVKIGLYPGRSPGQKHEMGPRVKRHFQQGRLCPRAQIFGQAALGAP